MRGVGEEMPSREVMQQRVVRQIRMRRPFGLRPYRRSSGCGPSNAGVIMQPALAAPLGEDRRYPCRFVPQTVTSAFDGA
jgi:hypothetical protein